MPFIFLARTFLCATGLLLADPVAVRAPVRAGGVRIVLDAGPVDHGTDASVRP